MASHPIKSCIIFSFFLPNALYRFNKARCHATLGWENLAFNVQFVLVVLLSVVKSCAHTVLMKLSLAVYQAVQILSSDF